MKPENKVYIGSLLLAGFSNGMYTAMPNYMLPLAEVLEVTMSQAALIFTFVGLGGVVASFFLGSLLRRFPVRLLIGVSSAFALLFFGSLAFGGSIVVIYGFAMLFGLCWIVAGVGTAQAMISQWFPEGAGKRIGTLFAASGVVGFLASPAVAIGVEQVGLEITAVADGVVTAAGLLAAIFFMPKGNATPSCSQAKTEKAAELSGRGLLGSVVKTPSFWLIILAAFAANAATAGVLNNASSLYQTMGSTAVQASLCISFNSLACIASAPLFGTVSDRFGPTAVVTAFGLLQAVVFSLALVLSGFAGCAVVAVLGSGLVYGSMIGSALFPSRFGAKEATTLIGFGVAAQNVGAMAGPPIAGMFYDATGSYDTFLVLAVCLALFCVASANLAMKGRVTRR